MSAPSVQAPNIHCWNMDSIIGVSPLAPGIEERAMAFTFDIRRPISRPTTRAVRSIAQHCLAVGTVISSFAFVLAFVIGVF